ncbi:UDP-N-acetylenolpyruvoylglucosamine reductase [Clostridia bacterium]|nr:UDP-N-acetylenolpyruvoylglucosamine reductase [Clostridia bacterium]
MSNDAVLALLKTILEDGQILRDEPMKNHTTFRIGGPADFLVLPGTAEQAARLVSAFPGLTVVGNGSNLLVGDGGIRGVVMKLCGNFNEVSAHNATLTCQSGALLSRIAAVALENGLSGFEFAAGIPGTLGGAVYMNAGAYGGEMKDVVAATTYVDNTGQLHKTRDHRFGYRHSRFTGTGDVLLESEILLRHGDRDEIRARMTELARRRRDKQPLEYASAGSTFKRPEGSFAGALIEQAGLAGYTAGGARVSEKHCGFVISDGAATFGDVMAVIRHVQDTVQNKSGVTLEPEVKICGC